MEIVMKQRVSFWVAQVSQASIMCGDMLTFNDSFGSMHLDLSLLELHTPYGMAIHKRPETYLPLSIRPWLTSLPLVL
jgi:hypothetical protein